MQVIVTDARRAGRINVQSVERLARCAAQRLKIHAAGIMTVSFITDRRMRQYNRRALGHDWVTDVLSFRYDGEPVIGEILIAPSQARAYAKAHGIPYDEELSRYVVHGLLHWKGHDDATPTQQRCMRMMEDNLLSHCWRRLRAQGKRRLAQSPQPRAQSHT